jgi:hypothetical protein
MPRPASGSRLRDNIDDIDDRDSGSETDALEPAQASQDTVTPPAAESVDAENVHHHAELPPLQAPSRRKRGGGILTLVILALVGMAIGFAAVVMLA